MATNTSECLVTDANIDSVQNGAVVASLCTTSLTGDIEGNVKPAQANAVLFN